MYSAIVFYASYNKVGNLFPNLFSLYTNICIQQLFCKWPENKVEHLFPNPFFIVHKYVWYTCNAVAPCSQDIDPFRGMAGGWPHLTVAVQLGH